jgi:hypothetical protein
LSNTDMAARRKRMVKMNKHPDNTTASNFCDSVEAF